MDSIIKCIANRSFNLDQKLISENINIEQLYMSFSDVEKVTHLVRQSLILRYFRTVYDDYQFSFFMSYKTWLKNQIGLFNKSYKTTNDELEDNIIKNGLKCINYLMEEESKPVNVPSRSELLFFCHSYNNVPTIGKMDTFVHFLIMTGPHHSGRYREQDEHVDIGVFNKSDYFSTKSEIVKVQVPLNISKLNVFNLTEISFNKFEFDPKYFNNLDNGIRNSFLTYLSCFDWTGFNIKQVIKTLGNFNIDANVGLTCTGLSSIYTYAYLNYVVQKPDIFNRKIQIHNATRNKVIHFMRTLRNRFRISVTDTSFLNGVFIDNNNMSRSDKLVRSYLLASSPKEVTKDMHQAYLNNRYIGSFEELDILSGRRGSISLEAEEDDESTPDEGEPDMDMDAGDDPDEDGAEEPSDSEDEPGEDDTDTDEDDAEDTAQPEKEPVDANTKMSDRAGINLVIDDETSLDEILYRQEIYKRIDILINKLDLPVEDVTLLNNLKKYWLNLLSIKSIQDILTHVVGKKNYN